ncbi:glycoside hydrolase family 24 [Burkholderia ubonensis]|uniref:lysozyme n=1 Tax=Burkholderia ubonensis TaxID=101571 RepID=UPI00075FA6AB|nr:lysozyme [Burkholderia ubonensis]KWO17118.1 glycoside hydrolase family 24 [Burkholderia ubonensis]ODQ36552.1 glycoside hydrolase family 24 [Burkholderia ubonensis]
MPQINRAIVARVAGAAGLAAALFAAQFEGYSNEVYSDPVGINTVCVGHARTGPDGKPLKLGQTYSDDVCSYLLGKDINDAEKSVRRLVRVPLSPGEQAAYTDFVFNAGAANFASSTLLKKVNAGDRVGACQELSRWTCSTVEKGKGGATGTCATRDRSKKQLPGLVKRRAAEMKVCLG